MSFPLLLIPLPSHLSRVGVGSQKHWKTMSTKSTHLIDQTPSPAIVFLHSHPSILANIATGLEPHPLPPVITPQNCIYSLFVTSLWQYRHCPWLAECSVNMRNTVPDLTVPWVGEGCAFYKQGVPVDCVKALRHGVGPWWQAWALEMDSLDSNPGSSFTHCATLRNHWIFSFSL